MEWLHLIYDNWSGTHANEVTVRHPTWPQVESAIIALDGEAKTSMTFAAEDGREIVISGGPEKFVVSVAFNDEEIYTLKDKAKPTATVMLTTGGQTGAFTEQETWERPVALEAAHFFLHAWQTTSRVALGKSWRVMNAPVSTEQAQAEAVLRSIPKSVLTVAWLATLLGFLFLLRFCAAASDGKLTFTKAILYGLLLVMLLFMNGFSLIKKSRSGYLIVAIVAAFPLPGILAQSLHLIVMLLRGNWQNDDIGVVACSLSAVQFVVTVALYVYLFSREVRNFVWSKSTV